MFKLGVIGGLFLSVSVFANALDVDSAFGKAWLAEVTQKIHHFNKRFETDGILDRSLDLSDVSYPKGEKLHLRANEVIEELISVRSLMETQTSLVDENKKELADLESQTALLSRGRKLSSEEQFLVSKAQLLKSAHEMLETDLEALSRTEALLLKTIKGYEKAVDDPEVLARANLLFVNQINPKELHKNIKKILENKTGCCLAPSTLGINGKTRSDINYPDIPNLDLRAHELLEELSSVRSLIQKQNTLLEENRKEFSGLLESGPFSQELIGLIQSGSLPENTVFTPERQLFYERCIFIFRAMTMLNKDLETLSNREALLIGTILAPSGLNVERNDGRNLFMLASERGDEELVELLMKAGVDPKAVDHAGNSALSLAGKNLHYKVQEKIIDFYKAKTLGQRLKVFLKSLFGRSQALSLDTPDLAERLKLKDPRYQLGGFCASYALGNLIDGYRQKFSAKPVKRISPVLIGYAYELVYRAKVKKMIVEIQTILDQKTDLDDTRRTSLKGSLEKFKEIKKMELGFGTYPNIMQAALASKKISFENVVHRSDLLQPRWGNNVISYLTKTFEQMKKTAPGQDDFKKVAAKSKSILETSYRISLEESVLEKSIQAAAGKAKSPKKFIKLIFQDIKNQLNQLNHSSFSFGAVPQITRHEIKNSVELKNLFHKEWNTIERQNPILLTIDADFLIKGPKYRSDKSPDHAVIVLGGKVVNGKWMIRLKDSNDCKGISSSFSCKDGLLWVDFEALAANIDNAFVIDPTAKRNNP